MMELTSLQKEIITMIEDYGGFSIFWATDDQNRASEIMLLEKIGVIQRQSDHYPSCKYKIMGDPIEIIEIHEMNKT